MMLDRCAIERLLPHRDPFLFLDAAVLVLPATARGHYRWSGDHPVLRGHFPERAVVPGVCQIEALCQLGGLLIAHRLGHRATAVEAGITLGALVRIRRATFRRVILADEQVIMAVSCRPMSSRFFLVSGTSRVGEDVASEAEVAIGLHSA